MITDNSVSCDETLINAPAELVWDILMDFDNYGQWNDFCPEIKGEPKVGSALHMMVDLGSGLQPQVEYVTHLEAPRTVTWSMENKPGDPIHADRTQSVTPIDEHSCRYNSIDEFAGEAVGPMIEALGEQVEKGFQVCAAGLKARAEALYAQSRD